MKGIVRLIQFFLLVIFALQMLFMLIYLPDTIATHWGIDSQVNGFMETNTYILLMLSVFYGIYLLFNFILKTDPKRENINKRYYGWFVVFFLLFFNLINFYVILWNMKVELNIAYFLTPLIAMLFIYIGYILPKMGRNYSIGIRTPWTLDNDMVWNKTNTLGKKLFILSGIICLLGIILPSYSIFFILVPILISTLYLFFYSYLEHKKVS